MIRTRALLAVAAGVSLVAMPLTALPAASAQAGATAQAGVTAQAASADASAQTASAQTTAAPDGTGVTTIGPHWQVQSSAATTDWTTHAGATQGGGQISQAGFDTGGWLPVTADSAGGVGTEVEALLQSGVCPLDPAMEPVNQNDSGAASIFYSDNMQTCFGPAQTSEGADTSPLFDVPWWFRTSFSPGVRAGQDAKIVINGVVGQADVWVNGTEVATQATVEGDYTSYTFDVTNLLRPGGNVLALEVYPNNPNSMFTLDDVDWSQIPPDNNTGIQFPVQLHVSDAVAIGNADVTQNDSPDMSTAALTVSADVTNNTPAAQTASVAAIITPPAGGPGIGVSQQVTLPAGSARTVTFRPAAYPQLTLRHPQLWWPYQMGGQPLYTLSTSVSQAGSGRSDASAPVSFGIRSVTTYLTKGSAQAPDGVRVFEINGVPFDFRAGGWSENLFLHYSAADLTSQIALIKSMGIDAIRTEGKQMPQDFYDQMDAAGILIDAGFQCCDKWQPSSSGRGVTAQEFHVMYQSSLTIGEQLRDHPSVINFSWSDNPPIKEQETASLEGFDQSGFQDPMISSAEYNNSAVVGPSGEKEGPYDWVPPDYWFDTTHSSNTGVDDDSTQTNVGGSFGFDSEQGSGDTVPTMDSIQRFLSPADQAALWQQPDAHQYHLNYESTDGEHSGYSFGTLDNLDTAIAARYGQWDSLDQYVTEAQVQNYENTRAQFEAYIDHWDNYPTPSTGTDYWQLNKGWPTMLWDLYNYDYDTAGAYFGAKKANENLHVLYALDTGTVTVDNLTGARESGLSVESKVYNLAGQVTADQTAAGLSLAPQGVGNNVLTPRVPSATAPPAPAQTYFVELILRQHGQVVDRNVYWLSTQQDVINWDTTEGNPQADNGAPLSQYADMTALQTLPSEPVQAVAATRPAAGGTQTTSVTITNPSSNKAVAFFLRADVRRGAAGGGVAAGDNQVLPITWSDNDVTLWPGESETLTATYRASLLNGASPVVSLSGWNVPGSDTAAPGSAAAQAAQSAAAHAAGAGYFGAADGAVTGTATPGSGATAVQVGTQAPATSSTSGSRWTVSSTANSPSATRPGSFTQGDQADTYTLTVANSGTAAASGTVTLTDVVDPDLSLASIAGDGWTCDTSDDPTEVCTYAASGLAPGASLPPLTVTVQVPRTSGYGTQDDTAGLHVTNSVTVSGGGPSAVTAATETPVTGLPDLTADNAQASALRQGDAAGRYQITVINQGGGQTSGSPSDPVTATVTALPAGQTLQALYGSGWTCSLGAVTAPVAEPADTCYRSDVLAGENGEEPPIFAVVSLADNAAASGNETVAVSGGGDAAAPASVSAAAVTGQSADLTAASTHSGDFSQGDAGDTYTLSVANVTGPNSTAGGASLGLVTLADTLPWGLSATAMTGPGWTCNVAAVTCYRSDALAAGSSYPPVTLTVSVAGNAPAAVTNAVTVTGGGMTSGPGSSTSAGGQAGTDPTTVTQSGPAGTPPPPAAAPSLTVTSTHAGAFGQGDSSGSYRLQVANAAGAGRQSGMVVVTDAVPAGLTPTRISGSGWTCSLAPPALPGTPNLFAAVPTCYRFGSLAAGAAYPPITMTVAVADDLQSSVTNEVSASGDGSSASATDATVVAPRPALVTVSTDSAGGVPFAPFAQGDGRAAGDEFDIAVANDGFAATSGTITVTATVPAALTAVSLSGSGWTCQLAAATCTRTAPLAAGQVSHLTLAVTVARDAPQSVALALQASGGGEVPGAAIDTSNQYDTANNGGASVELTYITPGG